MDRLPRLKLARFALLLLGSICWSGCGRGDTAAPASAKHVAPHEAPTVAQSPQTLPATGAPPHRSCRRRRRRPRAGRALGSVRLARGSPARLRRTATRRGSGWPSAADSLVGRRAGFPAPAPVQPSCRDSHSNGRQPRAVRRAIAADQFDVAPQFASYRPRAVPPHAAQRRNGRGDPSGRRAQSPRL